MLTPPTLVRRWPISLVSTVAAVTFTAGMIAGLLVNRADKPPAPTYSCVIPMRADISEPLVIRAIPTGASLTARFSKRYKAIDLLGASEYVADGTRDEVFDVELNATQAVKHIFVNGNGGAHQWDTVIGGETIPFGRVFGGHRGDVTWHVGVRENGEWRTSTNTGALGGMPAGSYKLELIGNSPDGGGARTVTVMFVDGTTITAEVGAMRRRAECYLDTSDCTGD